MSVMYSVSLTFFEYLKLIFSVDEGEFFYKVDILR